MSFHMESTIANAVVERNSIRVFLMNSKCYAMPRMDIRETRRANLRAWIDEDPVSRGNVESWCKHYSQFAAEPFTPSYIRQLVPASGKVARNIGEKTARKLEQAGGKPKGWLDRDSDSVVYQADTTKDISKKANCTTTEYLAQSSIAPSWPVSSISIKRFLALSPQDRDFAESVLRDAIVRCEDSGTSKRRLPAPR